MDPFFARGVKGSARVGAGLLVWSAVASCGAAPPARPTKPDAPGPLQTDPDKYSVVFENDRVRVLRYRDKPGQKTRSHHHPDSVLVSVAPFKRRLVLPTGEKLVELGPGEAMWLPEQTHAGENVGTTDTEVLLVEVKNGP